MEGSHFCSAASVEDLYSWFADETVGSSVVWERLCRRIADVAAVAPLRDRLDALPGTKRRPICSSAR